MSNILYAVDFFKRPFSLLLNQKPLLSTFFGAMVSLAIIGIMIDAIVNSGLVRKINPNVIEKVGSLSDSKTILYGDKLVPISFGLINQAKVPVNDPSIFSFDIYQITTTGNNIIPSRLNSFPCTSEQTSYPNPENLRCLNQSEITLRGGNSNDQIKLAIGLRLCNVTTDGGICSQSISSIQDYLINLNLIINFPNYQYDVDNYDNPLKVVSNSFRNPVNIQSRIFSSINIKSSNFITDNGVISNNEHSEEFYQVDEVVTSIGSFKNFLDTDNFESSLMRLEIVVSKKTLAVVRRYQKFLELLAALTGIGNSLMMLGWFLSSLQVYTVYVGTVLNFLYFFHIKQKKNKNNYKENIAVEKEKELLELNGKLIFFFCLFIIYSDKGKPGDMDIKMDQNIMQTNDNLLLKKEIEEEDIKIDIETVPIKEEDRDPKKTEIYIKYRQNQKKNEENLGKINIGFIEHFIATIKNIICKKKLNTREKLILKCDEIFKEDIDLVIILKRLQELEKLKILLLNSEQRALFNLMSKPIIYVNEEINNNKNNIHELSDYYHFSRSVGLQKNPNDFSGILEVYKRMKDKTNKSDLDKKILKYLSKDINEFCENFIKK